MFPDREDTVWMSLLRPLPSIDDFIDADEGTRMSAFLADPKAENPVARMQGRDVMRVVRQALLDLDDRERHIIQNRYGFFGGEEQTLDEIGRSLSLSRERIRQLERKATTKLRSCLSQHVAQLI